MCQALLEIMQPEINKIVEEATKQTRKEKDMSMVKKMVHSEKFTVEEIMDYVSELSIEEVRAIAEA